MAPSRPDHVITAVLGPTNTGKTYLAMDRLLGHATGMIGFPLRLLARENYERAVAVKGEAAVALVTGEEKIVPPSARYFICTVESMPVNRDVAFFAVDEIQLAADRERGHVFTDRLLNGRGRVETMFLGAETIRPLVRQLVPETTFVTRPRFSKLTYTGPKKLTRLPRRTAVVAFSVSEVYGIADLLRRQRGGTAVVMGALSPRTRNAQVALYQSGEVDYLVATDAIGMGLNMDVDHVAFASLTKFDGRSPRPLTAPELSQIAGRAGRHMNDGTFGVTADARVLDSDMTARIESHKFPPSSRSTGEIRTSHLQRFSHYYPVYRKVHGSAVWCAHHQRAISWFLKLSPKTLMFKTGPRVRSVSICFGMLRRFPTSENLGQKPTLDWYTRSTCT